MYMTMHHINSCHVIVSAPELWDKNDSSCMVTAKFDGAACNIDHTIACLCLKLRYGQSSCTADLGHPTMWIYTVYTVGMAASTWSLLTLASFFIR